jgi:hypothetical protein
MAVDHAYEKQREIALEQIKKSGGDYEHALRFAEFAVKTRREMMNKIAHLYSLDRENDELNFAHGQTRIQFETAEVDLEALREWKKREDEIARYAETYEVEKLEQVLKRKREDHEKAEAVVEESNRLRLEARDAYNERKYDYLSAVNRAEDARIAVTRIAVVLESARKRVKTDDE